MGKKLSCCKPEIFHVMLSLFSVVIFNRFEFSLGFTSGDNKTKASAIVLCSLYKSMHILQFKDNFEIEIAKFMHAYHNGKISNNFDDSFISAKNQHNYGTRSIAKNNLYVPRKKLQDYYSSLNYVGVRSWNKIPVTAKSLSQHVFPKQYKKFCLINTKTKSTLVK